jgi:hypothetical protein
MSRFGAEARRALFFLLAKQARAWEKLLPPDDWRSGIWRERIDDALEQIEHREFIMRHFKDHVGARQ